MIVRMLAKTKNVSDHSTMSSLDGDEPLSAVPIRQVFVEYCGTNSLIKSITSITAREQEQIHNKK